LESIDFNRALESAEAFRHLIKSQIPDEIDIGLNFFELALLLLLRLLLIIGLLLTVVDVLFFVVVLICLIWDENRVVTAKWRSLIHQISLHELSPKASIGLQFFLVLLFFVLFFAGCSLDTPSLLIDFHFVAIFVGLILAGLPSIIHFHM